MKKIYLTLALLLATGAFAFAQKTANSPVAVTQSNVIGLASKTTVIDTLVPESSNDPCFGTLVVYTSTNGGWVVGNNGYGDVAKAQKYYLYGATATVSEVLVFFGGKTEALPTSPLGASLMSVGSNGGPNSVILASNPITMANVDTTGNLTAFTFATPTAVPDSFFCNVILPATPGDSVGIVSTQDPCTTGELLWEEFSGGGGWYSFQDGSSWGLAIDAIILPVADITPVSVDGYMQARGLKLFGNFPNPANQSTTISFETEYAGNVSISIVNVNGQMVKSFNYSNVAAGRHDVNLDVTELAAGMYTYVINTNNGRLAARFNVAK